LPTYNKLIRDKIPGMVAMTGKVANTKTLSDSEYKKALQKKANEELTEYLQAENVGQALEELADLLEVIHALADAHGESFQAVETIRKKKKEQRGGFEDKVFLINVE